MSEAPKEIWAGPDEKRDWGVLRYGEDMFWEAPENSVPEDREGLTHYTRTDAFTPQRAAKVIAAEMVGKPMDESAKAWSDFMTDVSAEINRLLTIAGEGAE